VAGGQRQAKIPKSLHRPSNNFRRSRQVLGHRRVVTHLPPKASRHGHLSWRRRGGVAHAASQRYRAPSLQNLPGHASRRIEKEAPQGLGSAAGGGVVWSSMRSQGVGGVTTTAHAGKGRGGIAVKSPWSRREGYRFKGREKTRNHNHLL